MKTLIPLSLVLLAAPVFAGVKPSAADASDIDIGPVQALQGEVWRVDLAHKELTVKDKSGVLFDFMVESSTRIKSDVDGKPLDFGDLLRANQVTVKFAPEGRGDIAESVEVTKLD